MDGYPCIVCGKTVYPNSETPFIGPNQYYHSDCEASFRNGVRVCPPGYAAPNNHSRCSLCTAGFTIPFPRYCISLRRMPEDNTYYYHEICYKKVQIGNIASVAQPAEQVIRNDEVAGSIPVASSKGLSAAVIQSVG